MHYELETSLHCPICFRSVRFKKKFSVNKIVRFEQETVAQFKQFFQIVLHLKFLDANQRKALYASVRQVQCYCKHLRAVPRKYTTVNARKAHITIVKMFAYVKLPYHGFTYLLGFLLTRIEILKYMFMYKKTLIQSKSIIRPP